uniref:Small ribosomal subunit protein uS3c n=1 Tax=Jenufa perforata TaxID=993091 RepID=A0A0S2LND4_9CHLO|nr:ribosomal protein S3 [Jenufa perforata]ALO62900.1 ribosomal protein S3 [Jenufa perforata]
MGQKVHPLGFRLGITKKHESKWFARFQKKKYAQTLLEDNFLRQTLMKIIPLLLNKKEKNLLNESNVQSQEMFQPTNLKIERGLIPYEIEIQIHSGNCELLKSAFKNSEALSELGNKLVSNRGIEKKLNHNFKKTDFYLNFLKVRLKLEKLSTKKSLNNLKSNFSSGFVSKKDNKKYNEVSSNVSNEKMGEEKSKSSFLNLFANEKKKQKRLKKRQLIKRNLNPLKKGVINLSSTDRSFNDDITKNNGDLKKKIIKRSYLNSEQLKNISVNSLNKNKTKNVSVSSSISSLFVSEKQKMEKTEKDKKIIKKKFFDIFLKKINKRFFMDLKQEMKNWKNFIEHHNEEQIKKYGVLKYAPLGYQIKWSLHRLEKIKKQPLNKLKKLVNFLQMEAIKKMELLLKDYFLLGFFSKAESFSYYQMLNFIKNLKLLYFFSKKKKEKQTNDAFLVKSFENKKDTFSSLVSSFSEEERKDEKEKISENIDDFYSNYTKKFIEKFHNIDQECRQQYFLDYLCNAVKNHRKKNKFLYLETLKDCQKDLKRIQEFTKEHSNFLFGLDRLALKKAILLSENSKEQRLNLLAQLNNRVTQVLDKSKRKSEFDKNLQDVFLEKLQKQKLMYQDNLEFQPKILLKFYSVTPEKLKSNASLVADSIVDDLEKRKAFRRVIKQAKENLFQRKEVKGVKIQVSGRLNGAEIARTEWVRSGRVPLQTLRADLDYSFKQAQTLYGIIGVKVWIYKGEKKRIKI